MQHDLCVITYADRSALPCSFGNTRAVSLYFTDERSIITFDCCQNVVIHLKKKIMEILYLKCIC